MRIVKNILNTIIGLLGIPIVLLLLAGMEMSLSLAELWYRLDKHKVDGAKWKRWLMALKR